MQTSFFASKTKYAMSKRQTFMNVKMPIMLWTIFLSLFVVGASAAHLRLEESTYSFLTVVHKGFWALEINSDLNTVFLRGIDGNVVDCIKTSGCKSDDDNASVELKDDGNYLIKVGSSNLIENLVPNSIGTAEILIDADHFKNSPILNFPSNPTYEITVGVRTGKFPPGVFMLHLKSPESESLFIDSETCKLYATDDVTGEKFDMENSESFWEFDHHHGAGEFNKKISIYGRSSMIRLVFCNSEDLSSFFVMESTKRGGPVPQYSSLKLKDVGVQTKYDKRLHEGSADYAASHAEHIRRESERKMRTQDTQEDHIYNDGLEEESVSSGLAVPETKTVDKIAQQMPYAVQSSGTYGTNEVIPVPTVAHHPYPHAAVHHGAEGSTPNMHAQVETTFHQTSIGGSFWNGRLQPSQESNPNVPAYQPVYSSMGSERPHASYKPGYAVQQGAGSAEYKSANYGVQTVTTNTDAGNSLDSMIQHHLLNAFHGDSAHSIGHAAMPSFEQLKKHLMAPPVAKNSEDDFELAYKMLANGEHASLDQHSGYDLLHGTAAGVISTATQFGTSFVRYEAIESDEADGDAETEFGDDENVQVVVEESTTDMTMIYYIIAGVSGFLLAVTIVGGVTYLVVSHVKKRRVVEWA